MGCLMSIGTWTMYLHQCMVIYRAAVLPSFPVSDYYFSSKYLNWVWSTVILRLSQMAALPEPASDG